MLNEFLESQEHNNLTNKLNSEFNTVNNEESVFFDLGGLMADGSVSPKYKGGNGPNSIKFDATIRNNQIHINAGIAGSPKTKKDGQFETSYPVNRMIGKFDSHQGPYKYYGAGIYTSQQLTAFVKQYNISDGTLVSNQYLLTSTTKCIKTPYELGSDNRLALGNIYACMFNQLSEPSGVTNNYSLIVDSQSQQYDDLLSKYSVARNRPVTLIPHKITQTLGIIFITDRQ